MISLQNISKTYLIGKVSVIALSDIKLEVERGEMIAVMGPSGSGKSTLMNIIGLLDSPTSGELHLDGNHITLDMSDKKLAKLRSDKIGFVFQTFNLLPRMSALQNVLMPTIYQRGWVGNKEARATELLAQVGLGGRLDHKPTELSGGEQQRVAIARALINDPDIILADEPTGNLDSQSGQAVLTLLTNLNQQGKTVVIITHDNHVSNTCRRVVKLFDGKVAS